MENPRRRRDPFRWREGVQTKENNFPSGKAGMSIVRRTDSLNFLQERVDVFVEVLFQLLL
jgi:hypothetical protein